MKLIRIVCSFCIPACLFLTCSTAIGQVQAGGSNGNSGIVSGGGPVVGTAEIDLHGTVYFSDEPDKPAGLFGPGKSQVTISNLGRSALIIRRVELYRVWDGFKKTYYLPVIPDNQDALNQVRFETTQADNTTVKYEDDFILWLPTDMVNSRYQAKIILEYRKAGSSDAVKFAEATYKFKLQPDGATTGW